MSTNENVITNVFFLILENHSFDNIFGFSGIKGKDASTGQPTSINGLSGNESNSYNGKTYTVNEPSVDPMPTDPGHEFLDTLEQLCGPGTENPFPKGPYPPINNSGFVANYATTTTEGPKAPGDDVGDVMSCCDSAIQVRNLLRLAQEFAICDSWFSSMPGPTWPNRFFAMGASSAGFDSSPSLLQIAEWELLDGFTYPNGSIFDNLTNHRHQWRLYNDFSDEFVSEPVILGGGEFSIVSSLKGISLLDVHSFRHFANDLKGDYPYRFTFIEPNYGDVVLSTYRDGSSQHPMDSLSAGEAMVAATYNAIRNSPLWDTSLLIIAYDEHGGFYDHVAPPPAPAPDAASGNTLNEFKFNFTEYGVRVPAVVISPLIPKNTIDHNLYDHTSVLKTLEELYNMGPLTQRDAQANSLCHLISLDRPRSDCPKSLAVPVMEVSDRPDVDQAGLEDKQLPESGNIIGVLYIAAKTEKALLDGAEQEKFDVIAKLKSIETSGQAREYLNTVLQKVRAKVLK